MGKFHGRRAQKALGSVLGEDAVTRARELSELVDRDAALDRTCQEIEAVGIR
jgi:hypothetical protein